MKIGVLIPEFPGQTHIFFWRELRALREMGVDIDVISTRRSEQSWICHEWSQEAIKTTTYLRESSILDLVVSLRQLLTAGPRRWIKSLRLALLSNAPTFKDRLRAIAAIPVGARLATIARQRQDRARLPFTPQRRNSGGLAQYQAQRDASRTL